MLFLIPASYAQNTKGDKPQTQRVGKRENRFRLSSKKKTRTKSPYNRVQGNRSSPANRAASKPPKFYPQKGPFVNNKSVTGKIKKQNTRSSASVNTRSVSGQQSKRTPTSRVQTRSATGRTRNVYPQQGRFMNYSSKSGTEGRTYSNRALISRNKKFGHQPDPPKRRRVKPSSASRPYISKRSINAFAGFWNRKPKGEKAYIGDISGRPLRKKNYETPKPPPVKSPTTPYYGRKRADDRPYKGRAGGSHVSASRSGKAWRGDVAGRKIRGRNSSSKKRMESVGQQGGGYRSVTGKMKNGTGPIPPKAPGIGANRIGKYQGNIRGGGKVFSPQGADYTGNIKGRGKTFSPQGEEYTGNIKSRRPLKGGGSVSGKRWNNQGMPIGGKTPGIGADKIDTYQGNIRGGKIFTPQGADYSGNIKAKKPLKGGGSVSGKRWNNQGMPIGGKSPGIGADKIDTYQGNIRGGKIFTPQGADYSGNIKAKRPLKGGGSVSGKLWNNKQTPIPTRIPPAGAEKVAGFPGGYRMFDLKPGMRDQGEEYTGHLKGRRKPLKGGGSVSGKLWNNNGQPIAGKTPGDAADTPDGFMGKAKVKQKYVQNPNDAEGALKKKQPDKTTYIVDGFMGKEKMKREYVKNPNAADESLKKVRPDKSTYLVDGLQIKVKQQDYKNRPNAAENAMPGIGPGKSSIQASKYTKAMRQTWSYKHNPNSADEALDTHEPGKAFARATDYQGNIKMKKVIFGKKGLHPDAQFVKVNKNNTPEERDMLTNFKLWWAKLFKKSDTQPDHLKEKYRKPRYDKREDGLWYD